MHAAQEKPFAISKIALKLPVDGAWELSPPSLKEKKRIRNLLQQEFHYLDRGLQCYAFESEDGSTILKFFRSYKYYLPSWMRALPYPTFLKDIQHQREVAKKAKLFQLFGSFKLAYENLKEESGLIFAHLNTSKEWNTKVTLKDALGKKYCIDIDKYHFVIQRKATLLYPYLTSLIEKGDKERMRPALTALVELLKTRCEKGIADTDPALEKNLGFLEDHTPVFIDTGSFYYDVKIQNLKIAYSEIVFCLQPLRDWLASKEETLAEHLERELIRIFL